MDVRFLPNPYYVEGLRAKTGNDKEIQELIDKASSINSLMKNSIISSLKDIYHGEESANQ